MPVKCPSSAARGAIYTTKVTNYEVNYEIVFQKNISRKVLEMSNGDDGGLRDNAAAARQSSLLSRPQTQPSLQSIFQPLLHASSFPTSLRPSLARAGIHGPQHSDKIILPDYGSRLACRDVRMLAMFYSIQWPLKLPRKVSPRLRSRGLYIHDPDCFLVWHTLRVLRSGFVCFCASRAPEGPTTNACDGIERA